MMISLLSKLSGERYEYVEREYLYRFCCHIALMKSQFGNKIFEILYKK